ncbi:unnamed protein product [Lactuca virosa]|uniref:Uncharacterized protein n=1 Tax=Lactuca virosa TaxID=75947 RepID=A0AAU9P1T2_9ASTR|nr:unnamed protein product [Lactuca virosa]
MRKMMKMMNKEIKVYLLVNSFVIQLLKVFLKLWIKKRVEDDVNENLTGFEKNEFDDRTVNLGEDDKVIVAKKDGEGEDVEVDLDLGKAIEYFSNKNKDGDGLEIIQLKDSRSLNQLQKDKVEGKVEKFSVPSFSLGFSQDSEGSNKSSQSQSSSEWMTKKKIKDRVYLKKPSAGPECVIPNADVIDASPVSFAPPLDFVI